MKYLVGLASILWLSITFLFLASMVNSYGCHYAMVGKTVRGRVLITCNNSRVTVVTQDSQGSLWRSKGFQLTLLNQLVFIYTSKEHIAKASNMEQTSSDLIQIMIDDDLPKHFWFKRWDETSVILMRKHPISRSIEMNIEGYLDFADKLATN